MAKMFYTLQETAARLGVGEAEVKQMAADGKLQQFRDRDKLMFKRDQVDALAANGASGDLTEPIDLSDGSSIGLIDTGTASGVDILGDTDEVNPSDATDSGQTEGVSVFDTGEIEPADPGAQTHITSQHSDIDDEELSLDNVGSGSGLLDLTRESDDTSLGVALDEIYPGGSATGTAAGAGSNIGSSAMESAVGSSGVFESALGMESAAGQTAASSGLDNLAGESVGVPTTTMGPTAYETEAYDPAGSWFGAGVLLGALVALILGLTVVISQLVGAPSGVTALLTGNGPMMMWAYLGGLLVVSVVLGFIGSAIGKSAGG